MVILNHEPEVWIERHKKEPFDKFGKFAKELKKEKVFITALKIKVDLNVFNNDKQTYL